MEVFGRFMKQDGKGFLTATRVVPSKTKIQDLENFKLLPTEKLDLFSHKGKRYIRLSCRVIRSHRSTLERLNAITAYLKALYAEV